MADIAGTQQKVFYPGVGYAGDQYGLPQQLVPTAGFTTASIVGIGTFVCGVNGTKTVTQAKGSNTQLAGIVIRNQATTIPYADTGLGYSYAVPSGYACEVLPNGNILANIITSFNPGSVINVGDAVYADDVTGTMVVGVTVQPGYTQTDWIVIATDMPNNDGLDLVVISNVNNFLGS